MKMARLERQAKRRKLYKRGGAGLVAVAVIAGIIFAVSATGGKSTGTPKGTTTTLAAPAAQAAAIKADVAAKCPSNPKAPVTKRTWSAPPPMTINPEDTYSATIKTDAGSFTIALDAKNAPHTVNNFLYLASADFYNCVSFHRVIPGFMDQTGDPTGTGTGGPGYKFADENIPKSYATGDVAMANSGPNTNGSQFFIVVPGGAATLDADLARGGYSLFGQVTSGMSVVEQINNDGTSAGTPKVYHRILSVTIHSTGPAGAATTTTKAPATTAAPTSTSTTAAKATTTTKAK